jgi:hypothetical protein
MRKNKFSIFQTLETIENLVKFRLYGTIKRYKELWGVEDRAWSGSLRSVRAEATIKTLQERFAEIHSGNRRSWPES